MVRETKISPEDNTLEICLEEIKSLKVRRTGRLSATLSKEISLTNELKRMQEESKSRNDLGQDVALFIVRADHYYDDFQLSARWDSQENVPVEEKTPPQEDLPVLKKVPSQEQVTAPPMVSLDDVQNGKLGNDYAQKVNTILSTDYTHATQKGMIGLNVALQREFSQIVHPKGAREQVTRIAISSDDAKNKIDALTRSLERYKAKGLVK